MADANAQAAASNGDSRRPVRAAVARYNAVAHSCTADRRHEGGVDRNRRMVQVAPSDRPTLATQAQLQHRAVGSSTRGREARAPKSTADGSSAAQLTVFVQVPVQVGPFDTPVQLADRLRTAAANVAFSVDGAVLAPTVRLSSCLVDGAAVDATPGVTEPTIDEARSKLDALMELHVAALKEALGPLFIAKEVRCHPRATTATYIDRRGGSRCMQTRTLAPTHHRTHSYAHCWSRGSKLCVLRHADITRAPSAHL
eukprot:m.118251 g.118251  ORF g.118251 m.118251 type:complete len:255 (+) comp21716_c0_seq6:52-816(+)